MTDPVYISGTLVVKPPLASFSPAALDVYEALEQCQRHLANMLSDDPSHRIPNLYAQCREAELKARVTLAKARGENVDDG